MKENIIICGAPRAGTTSLFRYLSHHPDVQPPSVKELNFFIGGGDVLSDTWNESTKLSDYNHNFPTYKGFTIEASPAYMHPCYAKLVAKRIYKLSPEAKLIFILRDPIKRLYSHFDGRAKRSGTLPENFLFPNFVSCLIKGQSLVNFGVDRRIARLDGEGMLLGCYAQTIETYLNVFPSENIKIIFTEELADKPCEIIRDICGWLSVPSNIYDDYKFNVENKMIEAKFKPVYIAALHLNRLLEPVFIQLPRLRHTFRLLHNKVNAKPQVRLINEKTHEILSEYYKEPNHELLLLLDRHWSNMSLPLWLNRDIK